MLFQWGKIDAFAAAKEGEEETEEQRELHLGRALRRFKQSTIWENYQEGKEQGLRQEENQKLEEDRET